MKTYYELFMGGKIKYTVNYHDGVSSHKDGSPFYGIAIFKNEKKKQAFVRGLIAQGYTERA